MIMFTGRDPGGIPLDVRIHHFSLHPSPPQPSTLQPGLALQPLADYFGLNLWQEKGVRETTLGTAISFGFVLRNPSPLLTVLFLTVLFVQIAFGSSLDPKIHRTATQQSQHTIYMLSPARPFSCSVNIKTAKNQGPRNPLCSHVHTRLQQSCHVKQEYVYVEQPMDTLVWKIVLYKA